MSFRNYYSEQNVQNLLSRVGKASVGWLVVRGIIAAIFGVLVLIAPGPSTAAISAMLGIVIAAWLLIDGIAHAWGAWQEKKNDVSGWGWDMFFAVIAIIAGVILFFLPLSAGFFIGLFFLWLMAIGVIFRAVPLFTRGGGWSTALGVLNVIIAIVFVLMLLLNPGGALVAAVWVAGIWAIIFAVTSFVLAYQVNKALK
ncbi:HdeD family acid-resistance protein [Corynebacterium renale]|uniref:HdeD family acid-resistance protein n=1 Tax=Corynebacterium renale TaxID=1724 RepID=UPI000E07D084|nr:DUF308 domain-containing protein [Corynebacterium renale]STD01914.1 Uncharacterized conserved protein [Corynebacterium renale]